MLWYLFWFGLESGQAVFWLFNNTSKEYQNITNMGLQLKTRTKGRVKESNPLFTKLLLYIEDAINVSTHQIVKDLEIESQVPGKFVIGKIREFDINRAKAIYKEVGQKGEELVAEYFKNLKRNRQIKDYCWVNSSSESGYPYDFHYQDLADNVIYLDVKTTKYDFEQKIIYSDKEIDFAISQPTGCYNIYRVYNLTDDGANLRICKNCSSHLRSISENIKKFQDNLSCINTKTQAINLSFEPTIKLLKFGSQITLTK